MARMRKYGESKSTRIMMATVKHVTSGLGLRKFQADGFLLTRVYQTIVRLCYHLQHVELSKLHRCMIYRDGYVQLEQPTS